jgi:ABC-2 type transport system ATP-binding protein
VDDAIGVVELSEVTKRFGDHTVIDHLSLRVRPGTILGVIGPSGSGKTTAIRLMTGAYRPSEGEARLFGAEADSLGRRGRARIGYLPQQPVLSPDLSLRTNLRFLAALNGTPRRLRRRRLPEVLALVRLDGEEHTRARDASGGMQRRAALAGALVHDPELVFLDEPTAGIDPILRRELWERFRQLRDERRTLIITTQYVSEAAYCDEVVLISEGRLVAHGDPEALRRQATGGELIEVAADRALPAAFVARLEECPEIDDVDIRDRLVLRVLTQDPMLAHEAIRRALDELDVTASRVEDVDLDFDEVFVRLVQQAALDRPDPPGADEGEDE